MQLDRARQTNRVGGTFGMRRAQIARGVSPYVFVDEFACENRHSYRSADVKYRKKATLPASPFQSAEKVGAKRDGGSGNGAR